MSSEVKEARLRAGLTQAELARLAGVSQSNLCAIESGARRASPAMVKRLKEAMIKPSDRLRDNREAVLALIKKYKATNPRVFGSVARGEDTTTSDLDILVTVAVEDFWEFLLLPSELRQLLGIEVDVFPDSGLKPKHADILRDAVPL